MGGTGCQPLPSTAGPDAGNARLLGVRLERIKGAHTVLDLKAPSAQLSLDGTRVVMALPTGTLQETPDAAVIHLQGAELTANLGRGEVAITQASAMDPQGRVLSSPRVHTNVDGGWVTADGPVRLVGPNFEMTAAGAVVRPQQDVELVGPVEARAWPHDGGN